AGARGEGQAGTLPRRLAEPLLEAARSQYDNAWELRRVLTERSLEVLGPPAYHPLPMPGWLLPPPG
ncbi:MAG: hypothetical protein J5I93_10665, partial [Pirellulaceae bacterium]|nr:hypothetical protein [Pirellulaceae bacterium]